MVLMAVRENALQLMNRQLPNGSSFFTRTLLREGFLLILVFGCFFLWTSGFRLAVFEPTGSVQVLRVACVFLLVFLFAILQIASAGRCFKRKYFWLIVGLLSLVITPSFVKIVLRYQLGFFELFRSMFLYAGFLLGPILMSVRTGKDFTTRLDRLLRGIALLSAFFLTILAAFPDLAQSVLVQTNERFGNIRLASPIEPLIVYSLLYSLVTLTKRGSWRLGLFRYFSISVFVWYFVAVAMGRRTIFALLITTLVYVFMVNRSAKKFVILGAFVWLLLAIGILARGIGGTLLGNVGQSFSTVVEEYSHNDGNVGIRLQGIGSFLAELPSTDYLGLGVVSRGAGAADPLMAGLQFDGYNPNDHGIFAVLYQFGVLGALYTGFLLIYVYRDLTKIRNVTAGPENPIATALLLYMVYATVSLQQIFWKESNCLWIGIVLFIVSDLKRLQKGTKPTVERAYE